MIPEDPARRPDPRDLAGVLGPRILDVRASTPPVLVPAGAGTDIHLRPFATNLHEQSEVRPSWKAGARRNRGPKGGRRTRKQGESQEPWIRSSSRAGRNHQGRMGAKSSNLQSSLKIGRA